MQHIETMDEADRLWHEAIKAYRVQYAAVLDAVSPTTRHAIERCSKLHDAVITEISFRCIPRKYGMSIALHVIPCEGRPLQILFRGISDFHVDMPVWNLLYDGFGWGYEEFALTEDGSLRFSLLGDLKNELTITCADIRIERERATTA